ncbi:MAG: hypothetical protein ACRDRE_04220 [Pseudonocardiaceae bacterium]
MTSGPLARLAPRAVRPGDERHEDLAVWSGDLAVVGPAGFGDQVLAAQFA